MDLKNVLNGLVLCCFVSLAFAGDNDVFKLVEEQENRINFGEQVVKRGVLADLNEIKPDQEHPLSDIAHPRDEEFKSDEDQKEVAPGVGSTESSEKPADKDEVPVVESTESSSESSTESSEKLADKDEAPGVESNGFAFLSIKEISKQQLFALTAGAMFAGYCVYKIWDMFTASVEEIKEELKITLTHQDRDILFTLLQAMVQDIENLRENKHEVCAVGQVDIEALSEIIAPECKVLCSNFVELYNAIDRSGNNIEFIIMFYGQFEHAVQALLLQAEII